VMSRWDWGQRKRTVMTENQRSSLRQSQQKEWQGERETYLKTDWISHTNVLCFFGLRG
jgi:hypothetical protein